MTPAISRRTALIGAAIVGAVVVVIVLALGRDDGMPATNPPVAAPTAPSFDPSATPTETSGTPRPTASGPTEATRGDQQTVAIDEAADLGGGVTAVVASVEAVEGKAELPGEVGGPAISVVLKVTAGRKSIDFDETVVNAYYGADDTPAVALTAGTTAFTGALAANRSASGTYVFSLPRGELDKVAVEVDFALGARVTVFRGAVN